MFRFTLSQCPPKHAAEQERVLYRILRGDSLTDDDLQSYAEKEPDRYSKQCNAHGISLYEKYEDAVAAYEAAKRRNKLLGTHLGKLHVKTDHGQLAEQNGHYTLWLYKQVDSSKIPCLAVVSI